MPDYLLQLKWKVVLYGKALKHITSYKLAWNSWASYFYFPGIRIISMHQTFYFKFLMKYYYFTFIVLHLYIDWFYIVITYRPLPCPPTIRRHLPTIPLPFTSNFKKGEVLPWVPIHPGTSSHSNGGLSSLNETRQSTWLRGTGSTDRKQSWSKPISSCWKTHVNFNLHLCFFIFYFLKISHYSLMAVFLSLKVPPQRAPHLLFSYAKRESPSHTPKVPNHSGTLITAGLETSSPTEAIHGSPIRANIIHRQARESETAPPHPPQLFLPMKTKLQTFYICVGGSVQHMYALWLVVHSLRAPKGPSNLVDSVGLLVEVIVDPLRG